MAATNVATHGGSAHAATLAATLAARDSGAVAAREQIETPARSGRAAREMPARASRFATDDEILGIEFVDPKATARDAQQRSLDLDEAAENPQGGVERGAEQTAAGDLDGEPEHLRAAFEANPELRRAWQDAKSYRETFATPEEARAATAVLADIDRMDALFFSRRPEDHAELARVVSGLDPAAFASLAKAMGGLAGEAQRRGGAAVPVDSAEASAPAVVVAQHAAPGAASQSLNHGRAAAAGDFRANGEGEPSSIAERSSATLLQNQNPNQRQDDAARAAANPSGPTQAQSDFFHAANAAAVEGVLDAIETQVERLLPEGVSKSARNRVVGEIYRELDATLQSNRQLAEQMREAFRSGAMDAAHQRALVSLVTGRARQALPGVAKRVLSEWTSTIMAASQDRRTRQRAAERRVDIAGSSGGGDNGTRPTTPRDINYARMSDADILNL